MEFEPWWLLALPVFFALGWWASRLERRGSSQGTQDSRSTHQNASARHEGDPRLQALLALLEDEPDRAIDALTVQIQQEPDSVALQSALALLYRGRGETDRAIRVHQALADRNDLSSRQRDLARLELGRDFIKAGLIDRAEETLAQLQESDYADQALRHRIAIAQTVRDWPRALQLLEGRTAGTDPVDPVSVQRMHLHCEVAHASAEAEVARRSIDAALQACKDHPRPWLLLGQWCWSQKDARGAVDAWSRMLELDPEHLVLIRADWREAWDLLSESPEGTRRLQQALERWPRAVPMHRCSECGFKARRHYWQCPGCTAWDSIPVRGDLPVDLKA